MTVIALTTKEEFEDALADNWRKLTVIHFFATCDEKCQRIDKAFESLSSKYPYVVFLRVEVDKGKDALCALRPGCGITELPTFLFYKEELTVDKYCGTSAHELEAKIIANK